MQNEEPSEEQSGNLPLPESVAESVPDVTTISGTPEDAVPDDEIAPEITLDTSRLILSELKPMFTTLAEKVESLTGDAVFWKQLVEKKQEQIDKLYDENRDCKDGLVEQFKRKLVLGVIEQLDVADKQIATFEAKEETEKNYKNLLSAFRDMADEFRDMLRNRLDIIPFCSNPGEQFVATRHNALGRQPIADPSKDKTISKSKRHGYENNDGKVLRPELVEVFYYDVPLTTPIVSAPPPLTPTVEEEQKETMPSTTPSPEHAKSKTNEQDDQSL